MPRLSVDDRPLAAIAHVLGREAEQSWALRHHFDGVVIYDDGWPDRQWHRAAWASGEHLIPVVVPRMLVLLHGWNAAVDHVRLQVDSHAFGYGLDA